MKTIFDYLPTEIDCNSFDYNYQNELTKHLDELDCDFDQNIINQIVLWKLNRYAFLDEYSISLLNKISKSDFEVNLPLLGEIFLDLLNRDQKGVRLAMASAFLRFRNPKVYQIIDQRAYRFLYGIELNYDLKNINQQICLYTDYLCKLREACEIYNVAFENADRVFYTMDKKLNKEINLIGY